MDRNLRFRLAAVSQPSASAHRHSGAVAAMAVHARRQACRRERGIARFLRRAAVTSSSLPGEAQATPARRYPGAGLRGHCTLAKPISIWHLHLTPGHKHRRFLQVGHLCCRNDIAGWTGRSCGSEPTRRAVKFTSYGHSLRLIQGIRWRKGTRWGSSRGATGWRSNQRRNGRSAGGAGRAVSPNSALQQHGVDTYSRLTMPFPRNYSENAREESDSNPAAEPCWAAPGSAKSDGGSAQQRRRTLRRSLSLR